MKAANSYTSRRGTAWSRWFTNPAFRKGFNDARNRNPFDVKYDVRSLQWQTMYEMGRQFGFSPRSTRWRYMPKDATGVTKTLVVAWRRAKAERDVLSN